MSFFKTTAFFIPLLSTGCFHQSTQKSKPLVVAAWASYQIPSFQSEFENKTGVRVEYKKYSSNEELLAKIRSGEFSSVDVIYPSDYAVSQLIKEGHLQNISSLDFEEQDWMGFAVKNNHYDPKHQYSKPVGWGLTGIAIRRDLFSGTIKKWKDVYKNKNLLSHFAFLDDPREALGSVSILLGKGLNVTNEKDINLIANTFRDLRGQAKTILSEPQEALIEGSVWAAQIFSNDAYLASKQKPNSISFIFPEEGGSFWVDTVAILSQSKNPASAKEWLRFVLAQKQALHFAEQTGTSCVSTSVCRALEKKLGPSHRALYAPLPLNTQQIQALSPEVQSLWDLAWQRAKIPL